MNEILKKFKNHPDFIGLNLSNPNDKGAVGDTLMHIVSRTGIVSDMKMLLKHGGLINDKGDLGYTPLHYAAMKGHEDLVIFLLNNGADKKITNKFGETPLVCAKLANKTETKRILEEFEN